MLLYSLAINPDDTIMHTNYGSVLLEQGKVPEAEKEFRAALETQELAFEDEAAVEEALFNWQDGLSGFSDCLIVAHNRQLGCRSTAAFDARAARLLGAFKV